MQGIFTKMGIEKYTPIDFPEDIEEREKIIYRNRGKMVLLKCEDYEGKYLKGKLRKFNPTDRNAPNPFDWIVYLGDTEHEERLLIRNIEGMLVKDEF